MAAAVDRLKRGVVSYVCLMGKKIKSLQLKLKNVVVEFRARVLLILKVRRSFPWPKSSMPFCSSTVSKNFPPNAAFCFNHQGDYIAAVRDVYLSVCFLKKEKPCKLGLAFT